MNEMALDRDTNTGFDRVIYALVCLTGMLALVDSDLTLRPVGSSASVAALTIVWALRGLVNDMRTRHAKTT